MMYDRLLVQLVDRVGGKRGIEPEDDWILDFPIILDKLTGKNVIRRIIACMKPLVKLEALPNLDHSSSPPSMQHYLGR